MKQALIIALVLLAGCTTPRSTVQTERDYTRFNGPLPVYMGPNPAAASQSAGHPMAEKAYQDLNVAFDYIRAGNTPSAIDRLRQTEQELANAIYQDPYNRELAVALGVMYFYHSYYDATHPYDKCITFLTNVLEADPYATHAARYLANAYAQVGHRRNTLYYANYVETVAEDAALLQEMASLKAPFHDQFLTNWYAYEDFYNSKAARVMHYNQQSMKYEELLRITPQTEQQWGDEAYRQLAEQAPSYQIPEVQQYVQNLVGKLIARTPGPPFNYQVQVLDDPGVNAWATPGRIVVNTGLLRFVENEAELAGVLSHELAHIYAHHLGRQIVAHEANKRTAGALMSLVTISDQDARNLVLEGVNVVLDLLQKGYSRKQEMEADKYGSHIAFNGGYNPTFMTSFFLRLYEQKTNEPFKLLSTHPPYTERIEATTFYLENFPLDREMQIDSQAFQEMKQRLSRP